MKTCGIFTGYGRRFGVSDSTRPESNTLKEIILSTPRIFRHLLIVGAAVTLFVGTVQAATSEKVQLEYWEKWNAFEGEAMQSIVDDFNHSHDRIHVTYLPVSQINRKLMLATAGGVPPDIAGIWSRDIPIFSENNALLPLDQFITPESGIHEEKYHPIFWRICVHQHRLWALPSTPSVVALHWNKKMFREAGLDPEQPPRDLAELERFNERLTKRRPDGTIERIGYVPNQPDWWTISLSQWFGTDVWDGKRTIIVGNEGNRAMLQWLQSYPSRFGGQNLLSLSDGFGQFASSQNPFLTGRVAMVMQGVWMDNYIKRYGPVDFEYGVAPFPSVDPVRFPNVTVAESDVLVIPAGARHPQESQWHDLPRRPLRGRHSPRRCGRLAQ